MTKRANEPDVSSGGAERASGPRPAGENVDGLRPFELPDLEDAYAAIDAPPVEPERDASVDVQIVLGLARMHLEDVLKLRKGAVVPLDSPAGGPVEIYADGRLVGRGELLVLDDRFCVRVAEVVTDVGLAAA